MIKNVCAPAVVLGERYTGHPSGVMEMFQNEFCDGFTALKAS